MGVRMRSKHVEDKDRGLVITCHEEVYSKSIINVKSFKTLYIQ